MSINPPDDTPGEPEPVAQPEPVGPPEAGMPPAPIVPPAPPQHPAPAAPPQPYAGQPPQYGQPPQQPGQPSYGYAYPPYLPQPPRSGLGEGAKIGIGTGIGCVSYVLAFFLFLGTASALSRAGGAAYFVSFGIPVLVGIGLLFARRTRGFGVGILIISAAAWLVVIGPCAGLMFA